MREKILGHGNITSNWLSKNYFNIRQQFSMSAKHNGRAHNPTKTGKTSI